MGASAGLAAGAGCRAAGAALAGAAPRGFAGAVFQVVGNDRITTVSERSTIAIGVRRASAGSGGKDGRKSFVPPADVDLQRVNGPAASSSSRRRVAPSRASTLADTRAPRTKVWPSSFAMNRWALDRGDAPTPLTICMLAITSRYRPPNFGRGASGIQSVMLVSFRGVWPACRETPPRGYTDPRRRTWRGARGRVR